MKTRSLVNTFILQQLLFFFSLADKDYWIVKQLKPDDSCTKSCAGRRVRY